MNSGQLVKEDQTVVQAKDDLPMLMRTLSTPQVSQAIRLIINIVKGTFHPKSHFHSEYPISKLPSNVFIQKQPKRPLRP